MKFVVTYLLFVVDFLKISFDARRNQKYFLNQRRQNGCSKKSVYILQLLASIMEQITKYHVLQVYVVVETSET